jgi:RNA polymerase sigma factor (sigma-70 family)
MVTAPLEDLLRDLAPQVLGALLRRGIAFDDAEDAVQEALLAAFAQWPGSAIPANPRGWLVTVANRRLTDQWRNERARGQREQTTVTHVPASALVAPAADEDPGNADDTLTLLFMCSHPSLSTPSQIALTLRAVGGLTTAQIAHAFFTPEATMAQRISRAKQRIKATGIPFRMPDPEEFEERLRGVMQVLYLIFNEGYATASGPDIQRPELATEAIRLTRQLHRLRPANGEIAGLLALMLLTDARRLARTTPDGALVPLADQDRSLWNQVAIAEGAGLVSRALTESPIGPYQVQAAIAAIHDEAPSANETDWPQILALYRLLNSLAPNPMVKLNQAVAEAMVHGAPAGLAMIARLEATGDLEGHHRVDAVKAQLLELAGDRDRAIQHYRAAANRTTSIPEQQYLTAQADRLERYCS